jgi:Cu-Zn family superoxide dismutase
MKPAALLFPLATALLSLGSVAAEEVAKASASFVDAGGQPGGSADLTGLASGGVLIDMEVSGLSAGQWVAVHIHETGSCDHGSGHQSAGGHFNPGKSEHGFNAPNGPHAGDMPNQYVGADGFLRAQIHNAMISLDEAENGVRGRAIMVHAKADDYQGQPAGNAGDRIACAVIE